MARELAGGEELIAEIKSAAGIILGVLVVPPIANEIMDYLVSLYRDANEKGSALVIGILRARLPDGAKRIAPCSSPSRRGRSRAPGA